MSLNKKKFLMHGNFEEIDLEEGRRSMTSTSTNNNQRRPPRTRTIESLHNDDEDLPVPIGMIADSGSPRTKQSPGNNNNNNNNEASQVRLSELIAEEGRTSNDGVCGDDDDSFKRPSLLKRRAIQKILRDTSLSVQERNTRIQSVIRGNYDYSDSDDDSESYSSGSGSSYSSYERRHSCTSVPHDIDSTRSSISSTITGYTPSVITDAARRNSNDRATSMTSTPLGKRVDNGPWHPPIHIRNQIYWYYLMDRDYINLQLFSYF